MLYLNNFTRNTNIRVTSEEIRLAGGENRLKETQAVGSKTRSFCPSESKATRFQASLSSPPLRGTVPAQPSNGFFTHWPSLNKIFSLLGQILRVFESASLIQYAKIE